MRPPSPFIDTGRAARRAAALRRRRRARMRLAALVAITIAAVLGIFSAGTGDGRDDRRIGAADGTAAPAVAAPGPGPQEALGPLPGGIDLSGEDPVRVRFKRPPRAGLLVDLDTGRALWRRHPERAFPIASLTKMMTAVLAADRLAPRDPVRITNEARAIGGSKVGLLPRKGRVRAEALLWGLMLPSGNDAAIALAQRVSGTVPNFVRRMNAAAAGMGLRCTRFASPEGLDDGNRACPVDLAALGRELLARPRLARIVKRRRAVLRFPVKGGRLELYNHNPLLREGYPGTLGIKTGYTSAAGRCLVAAAERDGRRLLVVVLHDENPGRKAQQLLDRGFRALS